MTDNEFYSLVIPQDVMTECANHVRDLRIQQRITQSELAERVGAAIGTIKRFEHTGEIQFRALLGIALVLNRLDDFLDLFKLPDVPVSLYHAPKPDPVHRQRAGRKRAQVFKTPCS